MRSLLSILIVSFSVSAIAADWPQTTSGFNKIFLEQVQEFVRAYPVSANDLGNFRLSSVQEFSNKDYELATYILVLPPDDQCDSNSAMVLNVYGRAEVAVDKDAKKDDIFIAFPEFWTCED